METERMIYLVTEYASGGEIFGKCWIFGSVKVKNYELNCYYELNWKFFLI